MLPALDKRLCCCSLVLWSILLLLAAVLKTSDLIRRQGWITSASWARPSRLEGKMGFYIRLSTLSFTILSWWTVVKMCWWSGPMLGNEGSRCESFLKESNNIPLHFTFGLIWNRVLAPGVEKRDFLLLWFFSWVPRPWNVTESSHLVFLFSLSAAFSAIKQ